MDWGCRGDGRFYPEGKKNSHQKHRTPAHERPGTGVRLSNCQKRTRALNGEDKEEITKRHVGETAHAQPTKRISVVAEWRKKQPHSKEGMKPQETETKCQEVKSTSKKEMVLHHPLEEGGKRQKSSEQEQ